MDLASNDVLDSLLGKATPHQQKPTARMTKARPLEVAYQPHLSKKRCQCGNCAACADEARWERIFQEKFADPAYYSAQPPRRGSSLNW